VYGSVISLKSHRYAGGLLHSHPELYPPPMPTQQQVTAYMHKDSNNHWRVKPAHAEAGAAPLEPVRSGDIVRLEHVNTRRNLHSHAHAAPVTAGLQHVSCYGSDGVGDINDEWRLVADNVPLGAPIERLTTTFRLLHGHRGHSPPCALFSHSVQLPKWGSEQNEVACHPDPTQLGTLWNVEYHAPHPLLPNSSAAAAAPSFWTALVELHHSMLSVNNNLVPKLDEVTSQPWQWPLNIKGQRFTAWGETDLRVYLLGNPVLFRCNLVALVLTPLLWAWYNRRQRRRCTVGTIVVESIGSCAAHLGWLQVAPKPVQLAQRALAVFALAWLVHYAPFFLMDRVLYFHHYAPAAYFHCLFSAVAVHYLVCVFVVFF
jgi:dolichyl-phosphate-mannose-protein mannosyltransferase